MTPSETTTRTYRGRSIEELLPRIREELGDSAMITRQREGIIGGFAGFFGKKVLEVEACAAAAFVDDLVGPAAVPVGVVAAAYAQSDDEQVLADMADNPLLARLIDQSTPFATQLSALLAADEVDDGGDDDEAPPPTVTPAPSRAEDVPAPPRAPTPVAIPPAARRARRDVDDRELGARNLLVAGGLPDELAAAIVTEAALHHAAFGGGEAFTTALRRALAARVPVRYDLPGVPHTLALIGPGGAGRTSATVRLAAGYAAAGLEVIVLALEDAPAAQVTLQRALAAGVRAEAAATAEEATAAADRLRRDSDLLVVDTPPLSARTVGDAAGVIKLVAAVAPDAVHAVAPATFPHVVLALLDVLAPVLPVDRLLLTHVDQSAAPGALVSHALEHELPISYVSSGDGAQALSPADPARLARMLLP